MDLILDQAGAGTCNKQGQYRRRGIGNIFELESMDESQMMRVRAIKEIAIDWFIAL